MVCKLLRKDPLQIRAHAKAGTIVNVEIRESIADGLHGGIENGSITFGIIQTYVNNFLLVKEKTIKKAIYLLWKSEKQVVEGA